MPFVADFLDLDLDGFVVESFFEADFGVTPFEGLGVDEVLSLSFNFFVDEEACGVYCFRS